jgi:hypothetical protein
MRNTEVSFNGKRNACNAGVELMMKSASGARRPADRAQREIRAILRLPAGNMWLG